MSLHSSGKQHRLASLNASNLRTKPLKVVHSDKIKIRSICKQILGLYDHQQEFDKSDVIKIC